MKEYLFFQKNNVHLQSSLKPDDKSKTGEFDSQWKELLGDKANNEEG